MTRNNSETVKQSILGGETQYTGPKPVPDTKKAQNKRNRVRTQIRDFVSGDCAHCFRLSCTILDCFRKVLFHSDDHRRISGALIHKTSAVGYNFTV